MSMFTEWLILYYVKVMIFCTVKYTKNEIGELPDDEVSCDCINVTKLIKTNFSLNLYWKIIYLLRTFATKFSKKNKKHIRFQSAINFLCIGIIFIH